MQDCLFCKIASGDIPADIVYRDEYALAFRDINPQAPTHLVIIPLRHIQKVTDIDIDDLHIMGYLFFVAKKVAGDLPVSDGFRLAINCGKDAGQEVQHIHMHMLGGRPLGWPPG